ncbi:hypothetical protein HDE_00849 [Halotydeus destructor]|nr:hypothetical protein HDE_00849 [Halotydeus destructor]
MCELTISRDEAAHILLSFTAENNRQSESSVESFSGETNLSVSRKSSSESTPCVSEPVTPPDVASESADNATDASASLGDSEMSDVVKISSKQPVVLNNSLRTSGESNLLIYSLVVKKQLAILRSALAALPMKKYRSKLAYYVESMEKLIDNDLKFLSACRMEWLFFTRYYSVLLRNSYHGSRAASLINIQELKGLTGGSQAIDVRRRLNIWQIVLFAKFNFMTRFYLGIGCGFDDMAFDSLRRTSNGSKLCYSTLTQRQHFMCCLARSQKDIVGPKRTYERTKQQRRQSIALGASRLLQVLLDQVHTCSESQERCRSVCVNFNEASFGDLAIVPVIKRPRALFAVV